MAILDRPPLQDFPIPSRRSAVILGATLAILFYALDVAVDLWVLSWVWSSADIPKEIQFLAAFTIMGPVLRSLGEIGDRTLKILEAF